MKKLSVVVSAYNEEKRLGKCLSSVKGLADEVIVVNNSSTDKTAEIARQHGAQVFDRPNKLMLNTNKNFGFSKAQGEWILNLDADEQVTDELVTEIEELLTHDPEEKGYLIPRKNIIFGKWIENSIWWPDYQLRLFKKGKGKFAEKHIHELLEVEGKVGKLTSPLSHDNYSSISQFIHKLDKIYTESEADTFIETGKKLNTLDFVTIPAQDFMKTFFLQKGYRDGRHGLVLSLLQAFYSLVVLTKVWERQGFQEDKNDKLLPSLFTECRRLGHEFNYWFATAFIEESKSNISKLYYTGIRKWHKKRAS